MGNAITGAAGFALASSQKFPFLLFLETVVGLALIIASACVCNNFIDRVADRKMSRTKNRALATGLIRGVSALVFALILGVCGALILYFFTNITALCSALFGFVIYVVFYSFCKYFTNFSTLIGSVSGAVPPVVGYTAVSGQLDLGAYLLFFLLVFWQMPHFYAIAVYRYHEYKAANIPLMPIQRGFFVTRIHMISYIVAFIVTSILLTYFAYTGIFFLVLALILSGYWLFLALEGFTTTSDILWGKKMFRYSLVVIVLLSLTIIII